MEKAMYESLMATQPTIEANDALLATLCEYDVLWDGVLPPEIVDSEFYDCPNLMGHVDIPYPLRLQRQPITDISQQRDHREALNTVKGAVVARVGSLTDAWVKTGFEASLLSFCLTYDGLDFDHPIYDGCEDRAQIMLSLDTLKT